MRTKSHSVKQEAMERSRCSALLSPLLGLILLLFCASSLTLTAATLGFGSVVPDRSLEFCTRPRLTSQR